MSTRVEEDAAKAADAARLQAKVQKEARDAKASGMSREAFGKLVKAGDQKAGAAKAQTQTKNQQSQGSKVQKEGEAQNRNARTARAGIQTQSKAMEQARSFQGVLSNNQSSSAQADTARVERRDEGAGSDKVEVDDRERDVQKTESKRDAANEDARVEAREDNRVNAAIGGGGAGGGSAGDSDGRGEDRGAATALAAMKASTVGQVQQAQQAAPAPASKITPEMLEKLVSAVHMGVNDKGLKEFQIELKDGPLKGASMRISADDGKISLTFAGLDNNSKRLVEASKGDLMRRLSAKGLSLSRLDVK